MCTVLRVEVLLNKGLYNKKENENISIVLCYMRVFFLFQILNFNILLQLNDYDYLLDFNFNKL